MPYDLQTKSGLILRNIPDDMPPDAPQLRALAQQHEAKLKGAERAQRVEKMKADNPGEYDPSSPAWKEKYGPGEAGAWANLGAGFDTLRQGVQQLAGKAGIGKGVSDEDIKEKRHIDEEAAGDSWTNKGLQVAGEVLPTLIVPGAAAAAPLRALGATTSVLGGAALGNAAGAALSPVTSDESRGQNMAMAGALGAIVPGAGQVGGKVAKKLGRSFTESGFDRRAIEALADFIPTESRAAIARRLADFEAPTVKGRPSNISTSAAEATGDARLAQAEAASRARPSTSPGWTDFDSTRNAELYGALQDMTPSELRLQRLEAVKNGRTEPLRQQAMQEAAQRGNYAAPVLQHAESMLAGDVGANPAVKTVANYVREALGDNPTPGRLHETRKVLAKKLGGPAQIGDELAAATKGANRETMGMIQAIDDALAGGTKQGSTWANYLSEYGQRAEPETSGRVLRNTLSEINRKPYKGTTPEMTYTGLRNALEEHGQSKKFGDLLAGSDASDSAGLLEHLRASEAAGRSRKISGTMGGGSQTNLDSLLAGFTDKTLKALPMIGGYVGRLDEVGRGAVETQMARLLQNPALFAEALQAMPAGRREQILVDMLRGANVGAGGAAAEVVNP